MKYITLSLLLSATFYLSAQDYVPFSLNDGDRWMDQIAFGYGDPPGVLGRATTTHSITIQGDTIVEGQHYKKLYERAEWYYSRREEYYDPSTETVYYDIDEENFDDPYQLFGGIRQDTLTREVYFVFWGEENEYNELPMLLRHCIDEFIVLSNEEILLYQFPSSIGDTIITESDIAVAGELDNIVLDDGTERRRWHMQVDGEFEFSLIEGIGGPNGLFSPFVYEEWEGGGCTFLCYQEEGESIYISPKSFSIPMVDDCGALILSSADPIATGDFVVVPNPTRDFFTIVSPNSPANLSGRIQVYNNLGQLVLTDDDHDFNASVDATNWATGVHYLIVEVEGEVVLRTKILKVRD